MMNNHLNIAVSALEDVKESLKGINLTSATWTQLSNRMLRIDGIVHGALKKLEKEADAPRN